MMGALMTGSIVAAFFAGAIALFSPCCIVFLLPAYLATAVKNRRWRLLPLTLVFAAGLSVVLLPIMLGAGMLSNSLQRWHTQLYYLGGALLLALAVLALLGRSWHMPAFVHNPGIERGGDTGGIFLLGIFSGVASSCCAPVLAGVMTMSVLSSTIVGSLVLGLAYVFGMTFPLFLLAVLWDRKNLGERRLFRARPVTLRALGKTISTNTTNLVTAIAFAAMGVMVLILAANGNTTATPGFQRAIGRWLATLLTRAEGWLAPIPQPILALVMFGTAAAFVVAGLRERKGNEGGECCVDESAEEQSTEPSSV